MIETIINISLLISFVFLGGTLLGILIASRILVKKIAHEMVDHIEQKILDEDIEVSHEQD